ncbi:ATP-binding protein [Pararobbsia alpina]|uniref:ATP-binding protein n=1 Tax=Pararobbsia alpina TaxID=621374 RepID=UPI001583D491
MAFELFSQSANGRSHREGGLGIGLSVVRELAGAHGGTVSVRSDGPGRGRHVYANASDCCPASED